VQWGLELVPPQGGGTAAVSSGGADLPVTAGGESGGGGVGGLGTEYSPDTSRGEAETGEVATAQSIMRSLSQFQRGTGKFIRVADSGNELLDFFDESTKGAEVVFNKGIAGRGVLRYELPDGTTVQLREFSGSVPSETVTVDFPSGAHYTVHYEDR